MPYKASLFLLSVSLLTSSLSSAYLPLDIEEARYQKANIEISSVNQFQPTLEKTFSLQAQAGNTLWQQSVQTVQNEIFDDRPLYWSRLTQRSLLKIVKQHPPLSDQDRHSAINAFAKSSRGITDITYRQDTDIKILITGFDPFFLDHDITQSNPSGLAALFLDGFTFNVGNKKVQIESVVIPVRFADFDEGLIESILTPVFRDNQADMVFTISMGRDDFDLERFPGLNRSAEAPDNLNVYTGATREKPLPPKLNDKNLEGLEFVEFTLPVAAMQSVKGPWKVNDNRKVRTLASGEIEAKSLEELNGEVSVSGSGGGYLSNEISYRSIRLMNEYKRQIPNGHIHTPRVEGYDEETERKIVMQIRDMIIAAAGAAQ
ncbi:hypothetical protein [Parendozoicomonas haliclonae]|uniref:Pyrrolidone-carboxylate peptidase n=1 Tax=Parendozoicomonas haliclonae TaxID=1960125 RepID=A0A1X7AQ73_9GAMM|nr:hypothetical protein [Parendozoicomonas haliclonae]SMA50293.1 Pyrrolidone-carboxylate peptidase [Parendozoicomonas haliclonae]